MAGELLIGVRWQRIDQLEALLDAGARCRFVTASVALVALDERVFEKHGAALSESILFVDRAGSHEGYYLADELHDPRIPVVFRGDAGWGLVRVHDQAFDQVLHRQQFLWPLPEEYLLRGWRAGESRLKAVQAAPADFVNEMLAEIDADLLRQHVRALALIDPAAGSQLENLRTRYAFRPETLESTAYVRDRLVEYLGEDLVETQLFQVAGTQMYNVVGLLPGADPAAGSYVLCAHYDAIGTRSREGWEWSTDPAPGADDNGTGVALVLESARVLARHRFPWSVQFIAFSGEEIGLRGSRAFAARARERDDRILGVLNFDMVGFNQISQRIQVVANPASRWLAELLIATSERHEIGLEVELLEDSAALLSDHAPFWARGYDAILGIENYLPTDSTSSAVRRGLYRVNRQYHTVDDVPDSINWELVRRSTGLAVATLGQFARPSGLPNLAVFAGDLSVLDDDSLRLRVSNIGLGPAAGVARVRLERCELDTSSCTAVYDRAIALDLDPGAVRDLAVPWDRFGESVFRIEVDVDKAQTEASEEDNLAVQILRRIPAGKIVVFPNPFVTKRDRFVAFSGVPLRSQVRIFGVDGSNVWTGREDRQGALSREVRWNGQNVRGFAVSGGVYIYVIADANGTALQQGKLTVVR